MPVVIYSTVLFEDLAWSWILIQLCDSHVTKKTRTMCAAWNTVLTMLLLGVWEVEVWCRG